MCCVFLDSCTVKPKTSFDQKVKYRRFVPVRILIFQRENDKCYNQNVEI